MLGHSLLRVDISLDMANQKVTKIRSLEDPEEHNMHTEERQRLASVFWDCEQTLESGHMRRGRQRNVEHVDLGSGRLLADGARRGQHRRVNTPKALDRPPGGEDRPTVGGQTGAGHAAHGDHYQTLPQ